MAKKGAGAPLGNRNAAKGGLARRALMKALKIKSGEEVAQGTEEFDALVNLWLKQLDKACDDGEINSAHMIVDRLDGKPKQAIVGGDEDDNPVEVVTRVELVPLSDSSAD